MFRSINLCTSILPGFVFQDVVDIAVASGYTGIELRVADNYHQSLDELYDHGDRIRRSLVHVNLDVPVLNSYIPIADEPSIKKLLACCQKMDVPKARLVLPRSCQASVYRQAKRDEIIPSYEAWEEPKDLLYTVKQTLRDLERQARRAGVKLLLELHWGTVMSSFSSAYLLTHDLDPDHIAITFDPANMLVEGKEDWEYGIKLLQDHLDNVHVKNVVWNADDRGWVWEWMPVTEGMVDWAEIAMLLTQNHYFGDYAIEDFTTPNTSKHAAIHYLEETRVQFLQLWQPESVVEDSSLLVTT